MSYRQGVLYNPKQETFCQLVVHQKKTPAQAFKAARGGGGVPIGVQSAKQMMQLGPVAARISTLQEQAAKRAELSYEGIIREIHEEARLARTAGQHSAAMKGWELLGRELEKMFTQHTVIDHNIEFKNMSEEQLRSFILSQLAELELDGETTIDGKAVEIKEIAGPG